MITQSIIVGDQQNLQETPPLILKTKKQWRKEQFRRVVKAGENPSITST